MPRRTFHEPEAVRGLLDQITAAAAAQGLDDQALARRAGAAPETLSRLKSRGHGDFGLLVRLARVVGLRLVAVPDDAAIESLRRGDFF